MYYFLSHVLQNLFISSRPWIKLGVGLLPNAHVLALFVSVPPPWYPLAMHATFVTASDVTSDSVNQFHFLSVGANACQSGYGISSVCAPLHWKTVYTQCMCTLHSSAISGWSYTLQMCQLEWTCVCGRSIAVGAQPIIRIIHHRTISNSDHRWQKQLIVLLHTRPQQCLHHWHMSIINGQTWRV